MVEDDDLARRALLRSILRVRNLRVRQREGLDSRPGAFLFRNDVCGCVHYPGRGSRGSACDAASTDGPGTEFALAVDADFAHLPLAQRTSLCRRSRRNGSTSFRCRADDQWLIERVLRAVMAVGRSSPAPPRELVPPTRKRWLPGD